MFLGDYENTKWYRNYTIPKIVFVGRIFTEDVKDCQTAMVAKFGETITLQKIPQGYHNFKNL